MPGMPYQPGELHDPSDFLSNEFIGFIQELAFFVVQTRVGHDEERRILTILKELDLSCHADSALHPRVDQGGNTVNIWEHNGFPCTELFFTLPDKTKENIHELSLLLPAILFAGLQRKNEWTEKAQLLCDTLEIDEAEFESLVVATVLMHNDSAVPHILFCQQIRDLITVTFCDRVTLRAKEAVT